MIARTIDKRSIWVLLAVLAVSAGVFALANLNEQTASGAVTGGTGTASYFIKFDGIDGEAVDRDHSQWSDLLSFDQAMRAPVVTDSLGTTRRRGDVILEDVVIVKELDKASLKLAEALAGGRVFPTVEIHVTSTYSDGQRLTYYKYELRNVMGVSNQQKWDTLGAERSGAGWRSGEFPEGPVVASSPFGGLSLHLLPAL